ncbi:hypothetical protein [Methanococcoides methylutens]|uniref:hypothetical protein n=1 Tax=Methanococcoides methylutens TaxID=2226 RepID=UPI00064F2E4A|nr:hypothetical protein [Methanococcoides methylutens]
MNRIPINTDSVGTIFGMLAIMFATTVWIVPAFLSLYGNSPYLEKFVWGLVSVLIASVIGMVVKTKR